MSLGEQLGRLLIHEQVSEDSKVKAKRHFELTEFKVVDTHCPKNKW
jgi:hypothetical protein